MGPALRSEPHDKRLKKYIVLYGNVMFSLTQGLAMLVLGQREKPMSPSTLTRFLSPFTAVLVAGLFVGFSSSAHSADLTWNGTYRAEAVKIRGAEMTSDNTDKSYLLHHMVLSPKLVAADGITIFGRLDILNDPTFGIDSQGRVNSVAGDVLGAGPGATPYAPDTLGSQTNSYGRTQRASPIQVTALYGSWASEFGQLIVGRTPIQFGLGTAFSAGNGLFDHYMDTRDMVAYKFVLGNLFVMPMLGKMSEGDLGNEDDVNDYMVHVQYDNPESELSLGFFYDIKVAIGNDAPIPSGSNVGPIGGAGATRTGSFKNTLMSFYFSQKAGSQFRTNVEADILSGDTGVKTAQNQNVGMNAFGVAGELVYNPGPDSKWSGILKLGLASGDDPGTNDVYEGYQFNRNYDLGMLLFNHPLGQRDFMRTGLIRNTATKASNQIDTEAVSNALYLAPNLQYHARENLSYGATFVYAMLNKDPIGSNSGTSMNLGYELDLNATYKPMERLTWITELGGLVPGDAWRAGSLGLENKMVLGIITKAAISF
jgi:hypothetical protein